MGNLVGGLTLGMLITLIVFSDAILLGLDSDSEIKRCQESLPRDINCKIIAIDERTLEVQQNEIND